MKRKIFSFLSCAVVLIACFAISVFATDSLSAEKPWEDLQNYYGDSKESTSNNDHSSCSTDCDYCRGYDAGYYDGAHAGYEAFEQNIMPGLIDQAIEDYKNSEEFNKAVLDAVEQYKQEFASSLNNAKADAIAEYKNSDEYKEALEAQRTQGEESGTQAGYNLGLQAGKTSGYADGYSAGKNEFRSSELYAKELQQNADAGYEAGFLDGYDEGYVLAYNSAVSPSKLITLLIIAIVLSVIAVVLAVIIIKKRKVKRK